ncbi:MAG: eukaryotic-like serine/threonine-protein kinase [Sphingomonadales bacterium]|jgi:serine/threonine-protein kinase|nr:eukaryotic-like serine/threonine-protein kinase [Sphingomonadales bacterium]
MSDDKDKKPSAEAPTVFAPGASTPAEPTAPTRRPDPRPDGAGIKVGDVLNHIFEVKRFLARGGMGEVFEGCNVHTDEKVAIKVMLPALAQDEKVIAMFRKEAKTLTRLHHEALVEYRVLAQEPNLHVLYIVTDFIEGTSLSASLGTLAPTPDELAGLLARLAAGLGSAHALGAVHRDMSPDNVILENDDIRAPKIIDFGIAKDLAASSATIVGDGFAGKLNYVAPEQLGDFDREIGPWTDVYSLALVILAVAQGRNVDMSGSLVDAIDKRRRGPDLAPLPAALRPLIQAMLRPDPKERLRSMDEVVAMLGGAAPIPGPTTMRESLPPPADAGVISTPSGGPLKGLIIGGLIALLIALALGAWYWTGGRMPSFAPPGPSPASGSSGGAAATARAAINSVLPSVGCTWLDIGGIETGANGLNVAMRGVAGDEGVARDQLRAALVQAGSQNPNIDFADVAQITQAGCAALDAYRQIRATGGGHLTTARVRYQRGLLPDGRYGGEEGITALLDLRLDDSSRDIALIGIEPSGRLTPILLSRAAFEQAAAASVGGRPIGRTGAGRYRIQLDSDHEGWSGILLLSGRGPFEPELVAPPIGERGPDWRDEFVAAAASGRWSAEMVWYEAVDGEDK